MQIIRGGYSFVELDSANTFSNPVRIDRLLKAGTSFTPKTMTEEFADGKVRSAGKSVDVSVRTTNVDDGAGSSYARLKALEESRTPQYVRFVKVLAESLSVHTCNAAWNESVVADATSTTDAGDKKEGTASAKLTFASPTNTGEVLATAVISKDLTGVKILRLWIKSALAKAAGDLKILLDNSANCASPLETLVLPEIPADTWTEIDLVLLNPSALGSVVSIGIYSELGVGLDDVIHIDDVRGVTGIVSVINGIVPKVNFESNEAGKHNAMKLVGEGFADTESNLLSINL